MRNLPLSVVSSWQTWNNMWVPLSIDTLCPFCGRLVNLPLENWQIDSARKTVSASTRCPGCGKTSGVWVIEPGDGRDSSKRGCLELCIHPNPRVIREPILAASKLTPALARAYHSTLAAYNAGLWTACASSCRRALEDLVQSLLGDEAQKAPLFQQSKSLPDKVNLAEPLVLLADNLRKGGNVASHFDLDKEPDQPVAEAMVDLLDYFMEYIFVLKDKAIDLEKRLDSLGSRS